MVPLLFTLLVLLLLGAGYWITTRAPDEIPAATKPVSIVYALLTLILFAYFPWWQAALLCAGLLIGWVFGIFSLAVLATTTAHELGIVYLALSLALLMGARWRFEEQNLGVLAGASLLCTAIVYGIRLL